MALQHTMVPFLWRRHLGLARVLLGAASAVLYIVMPASWGVLAALAAAVYTGFAAYTTWRVPVETRTYPAHTLFLDLAAFLITAMHPAQEGLWLSTAFYFFLLCLSALLYTWRNVALIVLVTVLFFLLVRPQPALALWGTVLLGGLVATILSIQKRVYERRLSDALKRSVLSRYEAEAAREAERQRIGHDFHDGPLQSFISFQMRLEIIRKLLAKNADAAMEELIQLQELGKMQVTELRAFIRNMQPVEVDEAGLAASIREICTTFHRDTGIAVSLEASGLVDPGNQELATEVLQLIRESLNNVRKHSKASSVSVILQSDNHGIEILVEDDGSGFAFSGSFTLQELDAARLGPKSIKRRIRTLGGQLTLDSRPSQGAGLRMRIPA